MDDACHILGDGHVSCFGLEDGPQMAAVWGLDLHQLSKVVLNINVVTTLCNQKESGDVYISSLDGFSLPKSH